MNSSLNPFEQYVFKQIEHYKSESLRLRSKEPLGSFQQLLQSLQVVEGKLGGLEHEVALDALQNGFSSVRREMLVAAKQSWRNFWRYRQLANAHAKRERVAREESVRQQQEIRQTIAELKRDGDDPLIQEMTETLEQIAQLDPIDLEFSEPWRAMSWTGLWVDSKLFALYLQYIWARLRVFIQFHAFIFLLPILVVGIGYSIASKQVVSSIASLSPDWLWLGPATLIAAYAVKKYLIDKKLKKIQKKVETRLYKPLAPRLFLARNTALATKTLRMGRRELKVEA